MYRWEIHCCNFDREAWKHSDDISPPLVKEITLFIYAEDEESAKTQARKIVNREAYRAVECVEEITALIEGVDPDGVAP